MPENYYEGKWVNVGKGVKLLPSSFNSLIAARWYHYGYCCLGKFYENRNYVQDCIPYAHLISIDIWLGK